MKYHTLYVRSTGRFSSLTVPCQFLSTLTNPSTLINLSTLTNPSTHTMAAAFNAHVTCDDPRPPLVAAPPCLQRCQQEASQPPARACESRHGSPAYAPHFPAARVGGPLMVLGRAVRLCWAHGAVAEFGGRAGRLRWG